MTTEIRWEQIWNEGRRFALENQWRFEMDNSVIIGANVDSWNPYAKKDSFNNRYIKKEPESYIWTAGFFCAVSALLAAQVDALRMGVTT